LTLEVAVAKWWAHIGTFAATYSVEFGSILPSVTAPALTVHGSDEVTRLDVRVPLGDMEIMPSISLKHHVCVVRPSEWKLEPLGEKR
jgi:tripeptidyl-peptidase-2